MSTENAAPSLPPNIVLIENVALEEFEKAVYNHDFEKAGLLMRNALARLRTGASFINYTADDGVLHILYTRFAAAVVTLMCNPKFMVSQAGFDMIAQQHPTLDLVFRSSALKSGDHMLPILSANPMENDRTKLKLPGGQALMKFLLCYSLRSGFVLNFEGAFGHAPRETIGLWAAMITTQHMLRPSEFRRREELLGIGHVFGSVKIDNTAMLALSDVFMHCSYGMRPDKHAVKHVIMKLFARALHSERPRMPTIGELRTRVAHAPDRPTMLVPIEWFNSVHAMYRCWQPVISQLRTRFNVVGIGRDEDMDDVSRAEFDQWVPLPPDGLNLMAIVKLINEIAPHVVFYPSVGMTIWWTALAAQRFAPLQMFGLGHPATTHSPEMDFCLCEEGHAEPECFSEQLLVYPPGGARFKMRVDANLPEPAVFREDPEVIRVAIPAMMLKLNAPFMKTLKSIADASTKPIQFHFFPNMTGINLSQAAVDIRSYLPDARIYERTQYDMYLRFMRECDFVVCPFPFGGTNSTIDALHLGLPVIAWWGREPHERFDALMLHRAGMPDTCIAHGEQEFFTKVIAMANDSNVRFEAREAVLRCDLWGTFYEEGDPHPTSVVDVVWKQWEKTRDEVRA